jgi:hypothetical protein
MSWTLDDVRALTLEEYDVLIDEVEKAAKG